VHLVGAVAKLTGESDYLSYNQFGHASRVREGRVKDGDALSSRIGQIDLVRANTEAADDQEVLCFP
jgi:hypothetical protein